MKAPRKYYQGRRVRFDLPDKEWMHCQYWEQDKSLTQLAGEWGCTVRTVRLWMIALDVRRRDKIECAVRHSMRMSGSGNPAWNGGTSHKYHTSVVSGRLQVCSWCGATDDIQVHHIDHDKANGDPLNLDLLCGTCNRLESHLWALQENERAVITIGNRKITITFQEVE